MAYAAYLLENEILVLSRVGAFAPYFKAPLWRFFMKVWPHRGAFEAFRNKMTNAQQMPSWGGGGWPRLELTEPLNYQVRCCYAAQNALKLCVENNDTKEQYLYCIDNFFFFF